MPAPTPQDHLVPHISSIPANEGDSVKLFVREYNGTQGNQPRSPVLMLHGRSVPVVAGYDLTGPGHDITYSWAQQLASHHYDVFLMDLQGNGRSPRPKMDEPRNANPAQQGALTPNPLPDLYTGPPLYPHQLGNSGSEWAELATVVDFIKGLPNMTTPIDFVGWSAAGPVMGPYTLQHPENVKSLFLLAPIFAPLGRWSGSATDPFGLPPNTTLPVSQPPPVFGFPMHVNSKRNFTQGWNREQGTIDQRDPDMVDRAWAAMMADDPVGRTWGPILSSGNAEGVHRYRNTYFWGWNKETAPFESPAGTHVLGDRVPVVLVHGELDQTANTPASSPVPDDQRFSVPALYAAIAGQHKLMFQLEGAGHSMVWERPAEVLHEISKHWLLNKYKVWGLTSGSYYRDSNGELTPLG
ncbi:alpha/beta fold hydrolase [Streptomyces sp. NPDC048278]|uniref:alpha/beta fold hydrolase n=1 Tax=Streptomyces sp. NPDC048278 TaxID=3155809 RepID=UPI00344999C0